MNPNGHQSTSSCSGNYGYEPYMLGSSSFGVGVSQTVSASGFRRNGGRNSVRDCMQWDNISSEMSGNSARLSGNGENAIKLYIKLWQCKTMSTK